MYGFVMALDSLSANMQDCVPVFLKSWHLHWSLLAFEWGSVLVLSLWECFHRLKIPRIRSSLVVQSPGLRFPTSGIQCQPFTVAPRLYKPHSTEDKTPRLLDKTTRNSPEHPEKCTPKSSNISRMVSEPVWESVSSA